MEAGSPPQDCSIHGTLVSTGTPVLVSVSQAKLAISGYPPVTILSILSVSTPPDEVLSSAASSVLMKFPSQPLSTLCLRIQTRSFSVDLCFASANAKSSFETDLHAWRLYAARVEVEHAIARLHSLSSEPNASVSPFFVDAIPPETDRSSVHESLSPPPSASSTTSTGPLLASYIIPARKVVLKDKISEGFFGEVYKAEYAGKLVAVKKFKQTVASTADVLDDDEISLLATLRHPNIVLFMGLCYDHVASPTHPLVVMEFMDHGSLYTLLHDRSRLTDAKLAAAVLDICAGMEYLHSRNIIHMDLKPLNLLLDKNDNVKISDFGISNMSGEQKKGGACGTVLYMPAESIFGSAPIAPSVDVFSFGMVLYEVLYVNEHPSSDFCMDDTTGYTLVRDPLYANLNPYIPPWWPPSISDVLVQCLSNTPSDRPEFDYLLAQLRDSFEHIRKDCEDSEFFLHAAASKAIAGLCRTKRAAFCQDFAIFRPLEYLGLLLELSQRHFDFVIAYHAIVAVLFVGQGIPLYNKALDTLQQMLARDAYAFFSTCFEFAPEGMLLDGRFEGTSEFTDLFVHYVLNHEIKAAEQDVVLRVVNVALKHAASTSLSRTVQFIDTAFCFFGPVLLTHNMDVLAFLLNIVEKRRNSLSLTGGASASSPPIATSRVLSSSSSPESTKAFSPAKKKTRDDRPTKDKESESSHLAPVQKMAMQTLADACMLDATIAEAVEAHEIYPSRFVSPRSAILSKFPTLTTTNRPSSAKKKKNVLSKTMRFHQVKGLLHASALNLFAEPELPDSILSDADLSHVLGYFLMDHPHDADADVIVAQVEEFVNQWLDKSKQSISKRIHDLKYVIRGPIFLTDNLSIASEWAAEHRDCEGWTVVQCPVAEAKYAQEASETDRRAVRDYVHSVLAPDHHHAGAEPTLESRLASLGDAAKLLVVFKRHPQCAVDAASLIYAHTQNVSAEAATEFICSQFYV